MHFKIHRFELKHRHLPTKHGLLLESSEGKWSEVSPLQGRNQETLEDALEQLRALQKGWKGTLFPSVAFGVYSLTAPPIPSAPCALFLYGTPEEVVSTAAQPHGCTTAKLKIGHWSIDQTLNVLQTLAGRLHLRIDFNSAWKKGDLDQLCSHLVPDHIEFLEDPRFPVEHLPVASDAEPVSSIRVWKPMVCGLPKIQEPLILSSALESSIGLQSIASLLISHEIPMHALGLGTVANMEEDVVLNRALIQDGKIHFPSSWEINRSKLSPC